MIIDEATQANISSCLGAFQRAKNAIVVGDGKQLRHYSFLSKSKQAEVMKERQLNEDMDGVMSYRDCSILDLALNSIESQQQAVLLNEHFRSKSQLIHFSNQHFYRGKLKVMQHRPCTSSGHLHLLRVQGKRDKKGINQVEAQQVVEKIQQYIQQDSSQGLNHSIGVISPFRQQADYLNELIAETFS